MKLNENDYREIAAKIEAGSGSIEYEKDGETLYLDYIYEVDGYKEDEAHCGYENATDAWIETSRNLRIMSVTAYNEDDDRTPCKIDEKRLEKFVA